MITEGVLIALVGAAGGVAAAGLGVLPSLWRARGELREVKAEVKTNHGRRNGEYVEEIHTEVQALGTKVDALTESIGQVSASQAALLAVVAMNGKRLTDLELKVA